MTAWSSTSPPIPSPPPTPIPVCSTRSVSRAADASHGRIGWVLELPDASAVRAVSPDFARLAAFEIAVVTARSDDPAYDFVSRCFGPKFGIDEDPVTGSAHCALGPYWAERLGKTELTGYQASARGGIVRSTRRR